MEPLHVGCSGWDYDSWNGVVYEDGVARSRRLERYAESFDTVEVNASFYRLPSRETVARWADAVPDGFLFTVKASRYLTHVKRLGGIGHGIRRLDGRLRPMRERGKLGPVLWQLPPNFGVDTKRLARVLELLPPGRHAFEFREPSWFTDEVYELLADAGAALVIADDGRLEDEWPRRLTTDWTLIRLHYGRRGHRGNYSDAELDTWKRRIAHWRRKTEVFAYLNNDWEGFAPRNARYLQPGARAAERQGAL